jgi:hypothetical protein
MTNRPTLCAALSIAMLSAVGGCNREPQITSYDTPKENERMKAPVLANAAPEAAAPDRETVVAYDAPKSWTLDPNPRPMREMTFSVGEKDKMSEVIVMRFPAITFTNDVLGNINRWRGQVGLEPVKAASDQKSAKIKIGAEDGTAFDLPGKSSARQVVTMLPRGEEIWYFKFVGHTDTINAEWENFEKFLGSVKFGKAQPPAGDPHAGLNMGSGDKLPAGHPTVGGNNPGGAAPAAGAAIECKAPASWKLDPQPRPMREATYNIGEGDKGATVIVSRLPATSFINDVAGNINRWRNQVGMDAIKDKSEQKSEKVTIGGQEGTIYDLTGTRARQIVALVMRGDDIWYFKVIGNTETIEKEKAGFQQFLGSIKFAPGK